MHAIFTPDGRSLVDFIARSEHIEGDWQMAVHLIALHCQKPVTFQPLVHVNTFTSTKFMLPPGEYGAADVTAASEAHEALPEHPCLQPEVAALNYLTDSNAYLLSKQFAMDTRLLGYAL